MAVGDVMLAQTIGKRIKSNGLLAPWKGVVDYFDQADLVVANLECTISTRGTPWPKVYTFRAPPRAAASLAAAGIDVVSLANNHALDYGVTAFEDTLDLLDRNGIRYAGGGRDEAEAHAPLIVERNGLRIAFLSYVHPFFSLPHFHPRQWAAGPDKPGLVVGTPEMVAREVAAVRPRVDAVVVTLHGGGEFYRGPTAKVHRYVDAALGAGATLVIGHHPHVLQGYHYEARTLVAYSLGNFVFDLHERRRANESVILDVTLSARGVISVNWIPIVIENGFPRPARGSEIDHIMAQVPAL